MLQGKDTSPVYIWEKAQKKGISFKDHAGRSEGENEVEKKANLPGNNEDHSSSKIIQRRRQNY